ncbi:AAA family ATPase [Xanthomonas melonis]|uniref:AAA family ATPase n=1 Tax=Xanthomonas melonis TaxID=56456 RepID=A0ABS8NW19_9XANT|nr:AAA family ATPase [Xanthomonas melonis]MCD0246332.1 AAA family ATPase [Xanthomonas melonis]MCD0258763.1 AAA family ATPase [Xanthomonas melonis]MCD0267264.1 AAA family ATPase [Xanthomonas melonis]
MGNILVLAGVNGAGKSSLLGSLLREDGATWFNPDAFTRALVEQGWILDDANAQAWQEGVRRLRQAMADGSDYAFETTLGANTIPRLLREACAQHTVAIWFCGLSTVELHIERVAARVAAGGHAIAKHKIRERFDASRANLIALLPHLSVLHVYDNSAPADAAGQVAPLLVLEADRSGLQYPQTPEELAQVPDWAKPIVMAALETRGMP